MSRAEGAHFTEMYQESRTGLAPLSDPLDGRFNLHRQLSCSREEVYSDWLQWVLTQIADPLLIGRVIKSPNLERFCDSQHQVEIDREVVVEQGHQGQSGRLDLVITQGAKWLAVIEVKTRIYSEFDLEKHSGYRNSIGSPDTDQIFLSVDPPDSVAGGFRCLSWADLCVELRGIAPRLLDSAHILGTALILAFVGAVEQNLLGFEPPGSIIPTGKIPRMGEHLRKAAEAKKAYGKS